MSDGAARPLARESRRLRVPDVQPAAGADAPNATSSCRCCSRRCPRRIAASASALRSSLVGLSDRAKHKPRELSGGQEQRVGIARAIVSDPTLLLCDEPTGDLDRKSGDEILDLLQALNQQQGKTIIMVTHDPHAAARAKHVLHLNKGQLDHGSCRLSRDDGTAMFKYLPLLWANLGRKKLRTGLTLASIIVAFLLFGLMQTLRVALTGSPDLAGVDRLVTIHKISIIQPLPESYLNRIRGVDGVKVACSHDWFGGVYQDDRNQIAGDRRRRADVLRGVPRVLAAARAEGRVAARTAPARSSARSSRERFGWKVGDTIPMRSNIWVQKDGGNVWPMKIVGIYDASNGDNQSLYFHYDYLNESRGGGVPGTDRLGGHARRRTRRARPRSRARSTRCSPTPRPRPRPRPRKRSSRASPTRWATSARC